MKKIIAIMSILLMLLTSISIAFAEETTTDATSEATATETTATEPATTETEAETSTDVSETATEEVSVTPDSPLWGVKLAIEKIDLALTFNRAAKSEKGLKYARLRLLEVEKMMKKGDFKNAGKAEEARAKLIVKTRKHLDEEKTEEGETPKVKDFESRLQRHIEVLEAVKAKLEAKGVPTQGIENALAIAKARAECRLEVEQLVRSKRKAGEAVDEKSIVKVKVDCKEDIQKLISERKELMSERMEKAREEIKERKGKVLEEKEEVESEEVETEEESETEEVEETETVETTEETTPA